MQPSARRQPCAPCADHLRPARGFVARLRVAVLCCLGLLCGAPFSAAIASRAVAAIGPAMLAEPEPARTTERWYTLEMFGGRSGYMHETQTRADGRITTEATVVMAVKRGAIQIDIKMDSRFIETADGKPVSMRSVQALGGPTVTREYTFKEDGIELVTTQGNRTQSVTLPLPEGTWLTPAAADQYLRQRLAAGAKEVTVRIMDPNTGVEPIAQTRTIVGPEMVRAMGRDIPVTKTRTTLASMPGVVSSEYLDEEGELVKSETAIGGIAVVLTAATEVEARGRIEAPEVMVSTFIKPDRPIEEPRKAAKGVFLLTVPEDAVSSVINTSSQRIEVVNPTTVRVTVDTSFPTPAPAEDRDDKSLLIPSTMLDWDALSVNALVTRVEKNAKGTPAEMAEHLRRAVFRHIRKKSLGVGFASASAVAESREGDCSEHAVLLSAMLRAHGIPARVASGVIYADVFAGERGIFGYHMWSQALLEIDGQLRWVDLDATLPPEVPYDATHITMSVSSLADDESINSLFAIATLMGRVQIAVESIEHTQDTAPAP